MRRGTGRRTAHGSAGQLPATGRSRAGRVEQEWTSLPDSKPPIRQVAAGEPVTKLREPVEE